MGFSGDHSALESRQPLPRAGNGQTPTPGAAILVCSGSSVEPPMTPLAILGPAAAILGPPAALASAVAILVSAGSAAILAAAAISGSASMAVVCGLDPIPGFSGVRDAISSCAATPGWSVGQRTSISGGAIPVLSVGWSADCGCASISGRSIPVRPRGWRSR
eukprot:scaffold8590_cov85-Isochrysis_galbana.AAC.4